MKQREGEEDAGEPGEDIRQFPEVVLRWRRKPGKSKNVVIRDPQLWTNRRHATYANDILASQQVYKVPFERIKRSAAGICQLVHRYRSHSYRLPDAPSSLTRP